MWPVHSNPLGHWHIYIHTHQHIYTVTLYTCPMCQHTHMLHTHTYIVNKIKYTTHVDELILPRGGDPIVHALCGLLHLLRRHDWSA